MLPIFMEADGSFDLKIISKRVGENIRGFSLEILLAFLYSVYRYQYFT